MILLKKRVHSSAVAAQVATANPSDPLHLKYRPKDFDDVVGQDAVVKSLRGIFTPQATVPHSFLFTGPSGTGKTTLARIIASNLGALAINILEIDAARYSGIDSMREILNGSQYVSLGMSPVKIIIIDECHALSKQTWQTLLKKVEEPEPHLYWIFCTTESEKVPKTIRTRCHAYDMKPVPWDLLAGYLEEIVKLEGLKIPPEFISLAARKSDGSVRQGLVFVSMLNGIVEKAQALQLLEDFEAQEKGPLGLARMLCKGCKWDDARKALLEMDEQVSPETIRMTVLSYVAAALKNTAGEKEAERLLAILSTFSTQPWNSSERLAPALLAIGLLTLG
jgi:replication-associated recombination protein RarA